MIIGHIKNIIIQFLGIFFIHLKQFFPDGSPLFFIANPAKDATPRQLLSQYLCKLQITLNCENKKSIQMSRLNKH